MQLERGAIRDENLNSNYVSFAIVLFVGVGLNPHSSDFARTRAEIAFQVLGAIELFVRDGARASVVYVTERPCWNRAVQVST